VDKPHPKYSDVRQLASADELFEAYQSSADPDVFQVFIQFVVERLSFDSICEEFAFK